MNVGIDHFSNFMRVLKYTHLSFPLPAGISVELVPDPLVLGMDGTLVCSTELNVMSIQWQDSLNNTLEKDITGGQSLNLSLGNINDTIHNTVYTCIAATMTNNLVFRETVILSATGKSH